MGTAGEFEKADAIFQVALVGVLVLMNLAEKGVLPGSPLRCLLVAELGVHSPIELVHEHGIDAVLEPSVLRLEARNGIIVKPLFVPVALSESIRDPGEDLLVKGQSLQQIGKLPFQNLFAGVRLLASAFVAGAMVVNVPALLDLADE